MIDLYTWATPSGFKASIMLEEVGLEYRVRPVDIGRGEQFRDEYLSINPNGKIPAIVDHDGPGGAPLSVFESGAILVYLADKTGALMPASGAGRSGVLQWLMFQTGGLGPTLGQAVHFVHVAPDEIPYAVERFTAEARRLLGVMDRRLGESEYLAGDYSIADISCFPWMRAVRRIGVDVEEYSNLARWSTAIATRIAVQRGLAVPRLD
jgi:GST-like protein